MFETGKSRYVKADLRVRVQRVLTALNSANDPKELNLPGYRLHELTGDLTGMWSITISANWRVVFRFSESAAHDVDLVDYH